ncbi:hypothetical protein ABH945_004806 [Paraburkholderia sp. GAS333]|uniref:hypothetical protein n=1 Tax=Paraburkholderia sp. GAS333 TaxID=3156279 RepID=UPI003D223E43
MFNDTHLPQSDANGAQADFPAEDLRDANDTRDPAPRFSRLALCVTAASALTLGVVGTVAYGVWFEHDQQAYADAMASARQSLGAPAAANSQPVRQIVSAQTEALPVIGNTSATEAAREPAGSSTPGQQIEEGSQQAVWSGQVARAQSAAIAPAGPDDTSLVTPAASTASAATTPSLHSTRRVTGSTDSNAASSSSSRTLKTSRAGQQDRRAATPDAQQNARLNGKQNARHPSTLFARMSLFFRRVSYRQHGGANPQQQDIYSHP